VFHENPSNGSQVFPRRRTDRQTWQSQQSLLVILRKRLKLTVDLISVKDSVLLKRCPVSPAKHSLPRQTEGSRCLCLDHKGNCTRILRNDGYLFPNRRSATFQKTRLFGNSNLAHNKDARLGQSVSRPGHSLLGKQLLFRQQNWYRRFGKEAGDLTTTVWPSGPVVSHDIDWVTEV
jgi:hypothetical protein